MSRLAEEYMINEPSKVTLAGTNRGFERLLQEKGTDLNDASCPITEDKQAADELGIEAKEYKGCTGWMG